jgi:hypothetical protein
VNSRKLIEIADTMPPGANVGYVLDKALREDGVFSKEEKAEGREALLEATGYALAAHRQQQRNGLRTGQERP